MMITILVYGLHQLGNDINVYLSHLIEDLKQVGVKVYNVYYQEKLILNVARLWTINDFPAYDNLSGSQVKRYHACPICVEQTHAKRLMEI